MAADGRKAAGDECVVVSVVDLVMLAAVTERGEAGEASTTQTRCEQSRDRTAARTAAGKSAREGGSSRTDGFPQQANVDVPPRRSTQWLCGMR